MEIMFLMQSKDRTSSDGGICVECGLRTATGEPCCDVLRDQILARDYEQPVLYWRFHRMAVDAYCLQHSAYVASAKSLAAHLCGLCIAFEHGNDPAKLRRVQLWLSTNPDIRKPPLPQFRGEFTIGQAAAVGNPIEFGTAVEAWARSVWHAYHDLQPIAREWVARSMPLHSR